MDFATQQIFKCTLFISFCYWQTLCKSPFEIAVRSGKHWCQLGLNFSDLKGRTDSSDSWGEWAGTPSCKECWRRAPCCWGRRDSAATDGGKRCNNMAHVLKTTPLKKKKKNARSGAAVFVLASLCCLAFGSSSSAAVRRHGFQQQCVTQGCCNLTWLCFTAPRSRAGWLLLNSLLTFAFPTVAPYFCTSLFICSLPFLASALY